MSIFDYYFWVIYCVIDSIFALFCKFLIQNLNHLKYGAYFFFDLFIRRFLIFWYTIFKWLVL